MKTLTIDLKDKEHAKQHLYRRPPQDGESDWQLVGGEAGALSAAFLLGRLHGEPRYPQGAIVDALALSKNALLVFCFPDERAGAYQAAVARFQEKLGLRHLSSVSLLEHDLAELDFDLALEEHKQVSVPPAVFLLFSSERLRDSLLVEGWAVNFVNSPLPQRSRQ